jgi:hypothetical protein
MFGTPIEMADDLTAKRSETPASRCGDLIDVLRASAGGIEVEQLAMRPWPQGVRRD